MSSMRKKKRSMTSQKWPLAEGTALSLICDWLAAREELELEKVEARARKWRQASEQCKSKENLSETERISSGMTELRMQKLLYFFYGLYYRMKGEELFECPGFEA